MKAKKISEKLHGCGSLEISDRVPDGASVRIARKFLTQLIIQLCKSAVAYYKLDGENHFLRYHERMLYSQFAAAVHHLTKLHCSEHSLSRKSQDETRGGRADFWAWYRDTSILIELKRHYFSFSKDIHANRLSGGLQLLVEQTNSLEQQARDWEDKAALIGLDVILPYGYRKDEKLLDNLIANNDRFGRGREFLAEVLANYRDINFVGAWFPPSNMIKFEAGEGWEYNPYVGFAARLVSISSKKRGGSR